MVQGSFGAETLAERVQADILAAEYAFSTVEQAVNMVLPGRGDLHSRYADVGSVGLAVVVAPEVRGTGLFNPFDIETLDRVAFLSDNIDAHPEAWDGIAETAIEVLGGQSTEISSPVRGFYSFALAKLNGMAEGDSSTSFALGEEGGPPPPEPGIFRNAGGRRFPGSFEAFSGLWELHDHLLGKVFHDEVMVHMPSESGPRTAGAVADRLEDMFMKLRRHHGAKQHHGLEAAELTRSMVGQLLVICNVIESDRVYR